jgi:CRP-like cAMP-binding protein
MKLMNVVLRHPAPIACDLHVRGSNRILTLLSAAETERLTPQMERMTLRKRFLISKAGQPITHVYFPLYGVVSFVLNLTDGPSLEVGTAGNEGFAGTSLLLGTDRSPIEAFIQADGDFMRMSVSVFTDEVAKNGNFAGVTRRYAHGFFVQIAQSAACLQYHALEQRLCRWILMTHDYLGIDKLPLTQEFLALMLGVQRPTVSLAAMTLQNAGFISYRRGEIEILNRTGLEDSSCECYELIRKEFERLLC